jgi:CRISPR/Cas system CMR-associated protein Cmr5 small subunit
MSVDEVLKAVEQILLSRQLSAVERLILRQSWNGRTYNEMTQQSTYGYPHLKEVGSQLWHELSKALGEKVTKKNLHLVIKEYLNKYNTYENDIKSSQLQHLIKDTPDEHSPSPQVTQKVITAPFPGTPLPFNSQFYIRRPPVENLVFDAIRQPGCIIRIHAPQKMGKSSLLNQIITHAAIYHYKTIYLNFQEADKNIFSSLAKFLRWFCTNISLQLNLNPKIDEYWDESMGSKVNSKIYFEEYLLKQTPHPVVLVMDEVHQIFEYPEIAKEFLPMMRLWHEEAQRLAIWRKIRIIVAYATDIYIPLKIHQSPFNVGLAIKLPNFNFQQVQELAARYQLDWAIEDRKAKYIIYLLAMVGGHPYLINLAFYHLSQGNMTLQKLLAEAPTPTGIYSRHLQRYLAMLYDNPQLKSAMRYVVSADDSVEIDNITASKLESMGLIQLAGNQAQPSCQLYRLYFREYLSK